MRLARLQEGLYTHRPLQPLEFSLELPQASYQAFSHPLPTTRWRYLLPTEVAHLGNVEKFVYSLEVLHIPVLVGSLVYTLCLVIERFPVVNSLFLAAATATCVAMTVTVGVTMFDGDETSRSYLAYAYMFLLSLVESFLLILIPVIRPNNTMSKFYSTN